RRPLIRGHHSRGLPRHSRGWVIILTMTSGTGGGETISGPQEEGAERAVCVLGMTRSGTSLTMRTLNLLGVYLGPESELLPGPDASNPKGFWEQDKLKRLNNAIL